MTATRACGTRAKYVLDGCKCLPCTDANRDYERDRAARRRPIWRVRCVGGGVMWEVFNTRTREVELQTRNQTEAYEARDSLNASAWRDGELVETSAYASDQKMAQVRRHVEALRAAGVGVRQIARLSGVSRTRMQETMLRKTYKADRPQERRLYDRTADRILGIPIAIKHAAAGAYVPAAETWRLIDEMLAAGATKQRIASHMLGRTVPALQLGRDKVRANNAASIKRLHDAFFRGSERMRQVCRCDEFRSAVA